MTASDRVLALIPAREGSKGIPGKNIRLLHGKPLLAYSIQAASRSGIADRIVLSTDSEDIAAVGMKFGAEVPFMRPPELATDTAPMFDVVRHAIETLAGGGWTPDIVLLLQPTSPLRRPEHLVQAVTLLRETGADSVVSVVEVPRHMSPDYVMRIEGLQLVPFLPRGATVSRRQDARPAFVRDGTVYAFRSRTVLDQQSIYGRDCRPLVIPERESITIDSQADWEEAERRLSGQGVI